MKIACMFVLVLAAACGNKSKSEPAKPVAKADHDHAAMSPEVTKFHDVLSPRWHAASSAPRTPAAR
mgnify:CR=1 FL=1